MTKDSSPSILLILLCSSFNIFILLSWLSPSILEMKLLARCKLSRLGHLSRFVICVSYFYSSEIMVALLKFSFSPGFDFINVPFASNASLISL